MDARTLDERVRKQPDHERRGERVEQPYGGVSDIDPRTAWLLSRDLPPGRDAYRLHLTKVTGHQQTHGYHLVTRMISRDPDVRAGAATVPPGDGAFAEGDVQREIDQTVSNRFNRFVIQLDMAAEQFETWYASQPRLSNEAGSIINALGAVATLVSLSFSVAGAVGSVIIQICGPELTAAMDPNADRDEAVRAMRTRMHQVTNRILMEFTDPSRLIRAKQPREYEQIKRAMARGETDNAYRILETRCGVPSPSQNYATQALARMIAEFREAEMREGRSELLPGIPTVNALLEQMEHFQTYKEDPEGWRRWQQAEATVDARRILGEPVGDHLFAVMMEFKAARQQEVQNMEQIVREIAAFTGPHFARIRTMLPGL